MTEDSGFKGMTLVHDGVRDDPKLLNKVVGGSIPSHEIVSLLDGKTSQVVKRLMCSIKRTKTSVHDVEKRLLAV